MKDSNWHKILLVAVAVIVVGVSGLIATKVFGFTDRFDLRSATPNNETPVGEVDVANSATAFVKQELIWETKEKGAPPKLVPLFVSVPIVESNGVLIDMMKPGEPPLREPVSNAWLINNNLDYLNSGVLSQDPDNDGFINLAEWEAKTDPQDSASHPPYVEKIKMVDRKQQDYVLEFAARPDSERFQIKRVPSPKWPQADNFYMRVGEVSEDQQFRIESFEEKTARNNVGIEVDTSELTITYLPKGTTHKLTRRVQEPIPTYFAELEFLLEPGKTFYVKEGDAFPILIDPETKYRVVKANADSVEISYQTGTEPEQTVEIKKN